MFVKYLQCVKGYTYILSLVSHTTVTMYIATNARHSEFLCSVLFKHCIENWTKILICQVLSIALQSRIYHYLLKRELRHREVK